MISNYYNYTLFFFSAGGLWGLYIHLPLVLVIVYVVPIRFFPSFRAFSHFFHTPKENSIFDKKHPLRTSVEHIQSIKRRENRYIDQ